VARSIFVGDVHGCADELNDLLEALALTSSDRVTFVGDLVTRGPAGRGVLAIMRRIGAASVVGNHELRLLEARRARARGESGPRLGPGHEQLLTTFDDADWALLESLPSHLSFPEHDVCVVHAGVVPGRPLEKHDLWLLTHLRTIDGTGNPSDRWHGRLWGELYEGPPHVVFGHNARAALQLHPWATGIDTACVYGGSLTALVLESGQRPPPPADRPMALVSVPARAAYYRGGT
jgi:hypothetical protein